MRFKLDWASLIVGSKFTVFAHCFTLYLRAIFQVQAPGCLYLEGRIHGGAYFRNFTVMKESTVNCKVYPMTNLNSVHINVARVLFFFNIRPSI